MKNTCTIPLVIFLAFEAMAVGLWLAMVTCAHPMASMLPRTGSIRRGLSRFPMNLLLMHMEYLAK